MVYLACYNWNVTVEHLNNWIEGTKTTSDYHQTVVTGKIKLTHLVYSLYIL